MKWNEIYETEEALIQDMLLTKSDPKRYPMGKLVRGYEFVEGFKRTLSEGKELSAKQMTQLKRLAYEVYKNVHWDCFK